MDNSCGEILDVTLLMSNVPVPLVPGVTDPLTSRPIKMLLLALTFVFGVGGVAVAGRKPGKKLICEWLADNGVTGVVWLICDVCVNGVWLWFAWIGLLLLLWWLNRCKWVAGWIIPKKTVAHKKNVNSIRNFKLNLIQAKLTVMILI